MRFYPGDVVQALNIRLSSYDDARVLCVVGDYVHVRYSKSGLVNKVHRDHVRFYDEYVHVSDGCECGLRYASSGGRHSVWCKEYNNED
jgi:hypothetical protein